MKALPILSFALLTSSALCHADPWKFDSGGGRSFAFGPAVAGNLTLIDQNLDRGLRQKIDAVVARLNDRLNDRDWNDKPSDVLPAIMDSVFGRRLNGFDSDVVSQLVYGRLADRQAKYQRGAFRTPQFSTAVATRMVQQALNDIRRRGNDLGVTLRMSAERPNKVDSAYPNVSPLLTGRRGVPIVAYTPQELQDSYNKVSWQLRDLGSGFSGIQLWDGRFDTIRTITDAINSRIKDKINVDVLRKIRL